MEQHRRRIAYLFMVYGGLSFIFSLIISFSVSAHHTDAFLSPMPSLPIVLGLVLTLSFLPLLAGWALLREKQHLMWLPILAAVIMLLSFPIGSLLAAYYFWYLYESHRDK